MVNFCLKLAGISLEVNCKYNSTKEYCKDYFTDAAPVYVLTVSQAEREREQVFQGDVIRMSGAGARETFTVRKLSFGVGVERTFPLHSPKIARLEVVRHGQIRRAKLYYLRDRVGKAARIREKRI